MSDVVIVCGPPASGKTTITKDYISKGYKNLNRDTEGGTIADLLPKMSGLLMAGHKVVLDNLFATAETRKPFIELAKKFGRTISCVIMGTSIEDAQFNAVQRMINIMGYLPSHEEIKKSKNPSIFPIVVFFKYKKEYEKPSIEEGFSKVETVKFSRKPSEFTGKALILDYDGTLRECIGGNEKYPVLPEQIEIKPNRTNVLSAYKAKGYHLLGASNQSGVQKGELTFDTARELFNHTNQLLGHHIEVDFCPHQSAPPVCYCRKPQVAIGVNFINKYKLNPSDTIFVGDYTTDATFAKRCGFQYVDQAEFFK